MIGSKRCHGVVWYNKDNNFWIKREIILFCVCLKKIIFHISNLLFITPQILGLFLFYITSEIIIPELFNPKIKQSKDKDVFLQSSSIRLRSQIGNKSFSKVV